MKKLLVFLLAIFIAFSFVACDNNSALLPDSVFISAPENNSKNNPNFGGKTDQEKFKFCDDIYLEFLNSFLRNSSVIELINNASNNGYNLIPGTYSKENLTLIVYTERTYSLSFKKFYFDSGLELWGTVSLDLNNNMHINAVIRNTASGGVFDFVYDEKTVPIDEYGQDWAGFFTLNGYYIDVAQTIPR